MTCPKKTRNFDARIQLDFPRCGLTTLRMSSRRFARLWATTIMSPWTQNSPGWWRDPSGNSNLRQTTSIRYPFIRDSFYRADINLLFYFLQLLRCNVDLLKIIQLGLTFFNKEGGTPEGVCTWQVTAPYGTCLSLFLTAVLFQFNFKFNLSEDMYAEDSVELLQVSTNSKD